MSLCLILFLERQKDTYHTHTHTHIERAVILFLDAMSYDHTWIHTHKHRHQLSAFVCRGSYHAAALQEGAEGFWGTMHRHLTSLAWPCVSTPFEPCVRGHRHLHPHTEIDCSFSTGSMTDSQTGQLCFLFLKCWCNVLCWFKISLCVRADEIESIFHFMLTFWWL